MPEESFPMWGKGKFLLLAVAFAAFCCKKSEQQLMVPSAVDDRYIGCRDKALEKFIKGGVLNEELKRNVGFSTAWHIKTPCLKHTKPSREHFLALRAFDEESDFISSDFNKAVRSLGANATIYENQFHFKSLHFLLMDSMREQQPKDCKTVYALLSNSYKASKGSKLRLGQFLKAYCSFRDLKNMHDLDGMFVLNITSCFFAKMGTDICSPEDTVLLSPAEVFTVEDLGTVDQDDTEYQVMTLKHANLFSYNNCYIFSRSTVESATYWLVLGLAAWSLTS